MISKETYGLIDCRLDIYYAVLCHWISFSRVCLGFIRWSDLQDKVKIAIQIHQGFRLTWNCGCCCISCCNRSWRKHNKKKNWCNSEQGATLSVNLSCALNFSRSESNFMHLCSCLNDWLLFLLECVCTCEVEMTFGWGGFLCLQVVLGWWATSAKCYFCSATC